MGGGIVAERFEEMKKGQAERLFPMLEEVLGEVGAVWEELDAIGVGVGPGNFTGIRIAVSAARGLALGLDIPAIGVNGFEAMLGPELLSDKRPTIASIPSTRRYGDVVLQLVQCGALVGDPVEIALDTEPQVAWETIEHLPSKTFVCGERAELLDVFFNERHGQPENYLAITDKTRDIAKSVASVAVSKLLKSEDHAPPTPLYIRPPDAAPAADPPPVILP